MQKVSQNISFYTMPPKQALTTLNIPVRQDKALTIHSHTPDKAAEKITSVCLPRCARPMQSL